MAEYEPGTAFLPSNINGCFTPRLKAALFPQQEIISLQQGRSVSSASDGNFISMKFFFISMKRGGFQREFLVGCWTWQPS